MRLAFALLSLTACGDTVLDLLPKDGSTDATDACSVDLQSDPNNCGACGKTCAHNQYCSSGACTCLPNMTLCGTSCFDLRSDPDHCGSCTATPCSAGDKCESSSCQTGTCTSPLTACDVSGRSACVDLSAGEPYCGTCGTVCSPNEICAANHCQPYEPATPCTSCPCTTCDSRACCPPIGTQPNPICVTGTACP